MKYIFGGIFLFLYFTANAIEPDLKAKNVLVMNISSNEIVLNKNENEIVPIASITKLMTALVVLEANLDMDEIITITQEDIIATKGDSSHNQLAVGAQFTREELLLLALMSSNNRAAAALARTYPGGYDACITAMNLKARSLEMYDTSFSDPSGLTPGNKSSASDLAKLVLAATAFSEIKRFSTEKAYTTQQILKRNKIKKISYGTTNRLLLTDDWNINLQKTGFTRAAGFCVVMNLTVSNEEFIIILLNNESKQQRAIDAIKIKYWLEYKIIPSKNVLITLNPYKSKPPPRKNKHNQR